MALREPSIEAKGTRIDRVLMQDVPGDDYRSSQVRDLRDAMNEYILAELENSNDDRASTNRIFNSIIARLEALESKMVDNTPNGGYFIGGVASELVVVGK